MGGKRFKHCLPKIGDLMVSLVDGIPETINWIDSNLFINYKSELVQINDWDLSLIETINWICAFYSNVDKVFFTKPRKIIQTRHVVPGPSVLIFMVVENQANHGIPFIYFFPTWSWFSHQSIAVTIDCISLKYICLRNMFCYLGFSRTIKFLYKALVNLTGFV